MCECGNAYVCILTTLREWSLEYTGLCAKILVSVAAVHEPVDARGPLVCSHGVGRAEIGVRVCATARPGRDGLIGTAKCAPRPHGTTTTVTPTATMVYLQVTTSVDRPAATGRDDHQAHQEEDRIHMRLCQFSRRAQGETEDGKRRGMPWWWRV